MITYEELQDAFYLWAVSIDGGVIFWEEDNGPKEDAPAISLKIMMVEPVGHSFKAQNVSDAGITTLYNINEVFLRFNAYGLNAWGRLERFKMAGELKEEARALRDSTGLSLLRSGSNQNITGLNDTLNETRFTMTSVFSGAVDISDVDIGIIDTVNIDYTYKNGTTKTGTINITTP